MQAPEASNNQPIKIQHRSQHKGDRSRSSYPFEQLSTVTASADRCPLIPCMPDPSRGAGAAPSPRITELAGLHAALSSEGVQLPGSSKQQQQPPQQLEQGQSPLRSGLKQQQQHRQQPSQADAVMAGASQTSAKLGQVGNELSVISSRLQDLGRSKQVHTPSARALAAKLGSGRASPAVQAQSTSARGSMDLKFADPELVQELRQQLTTSSKLVMQRVSRSASPDKPGAHRPGHTSGSASVSSKASGRSADQPHHHQQQQQAGNLTPAAQQQQQQQQQQQVLLGLAGTGSNASAAAAALAQRLANSKALHRLQRQQQQHQPQQPPASQQELAQRGLQQMQDLTEVSQMLLPGLAAQHAAVAECQAKMGAVSRVLQKHPQLANPSVLQEVYEKNQQLESMLEQLRRENQAKDLAHSNTLSVLREINATPRDRRVAQLQHENLVLQQQLMSREAQMQRMQGMLASRASSQQQQQPHQQGHQHSSGELSPVAAEGQRYDDLTSPATRQVNRTLWGPLHGAGGHPEDGAHSSSSGSGSDVSGSSGNGTAGSSRSSTPRSESEAGAAGTAASFELQLGRLREQNQQLQRSLSPGRVGSITAQFEQQYAASRASVPVMQQQLHALRASANQAGVFSGAVPGELHSQPTTPTGHQQSGSSSSSHPAATSVDDLKAQVQQQWSALDKQQQQFAGIRASLEASHKRQMETEHMQREHAQQKYEKLKITTEQLVAQLQDAHAQVTMLQQQASLSNRRSSGSGIGSSGGGAASDRQQQQRQRLLQESAVRELQGQLSQARQEKAELQTCLDRVQAENAEHKLEMKKQVHRLKLAEQALLDYQAQKDQVSQLKQCNQDLQQQLAAVQAVQAAAEGAAQECRRQLTAAGAEKAVLMDRIRELANRALIAECHTHRSHSGDSSSQGGAAEGQGQHSQQEQQLSAAVTELNQQVALLRGQLTDAESKEEQLQVSNAALQERLSRLQAEYAANDAGTSSRRSSTSISQPQQQQQVQELLQQVAGLQAQLAAGAAARAATNAAVAVAGGGAQQVEALQEEVQQLQAVLDDRTLELQEWQVHADALEKDLEDLKAQVVAAEGLQEELEGAQAQLAAARSQQQQLQQELEQTRGKVSQLEYDLHGVGQERAALRARVDALTAELSAAREGTADLRLRLDHFTGPTGPQARVKQLESALQLAQRKLDAAEARAATASSRVSELTQQLGGAEDQIVSLEGHISVLEEQLAGYTQLPQ